MSSSDFVQSRAGARTRLAIATAMLSLPPVALVQVVNQASVGATLLGLAMAALGTYFVTEFYAWLTDKGVFPWMGRVRTVANVEMDVPTWKTLEEPLKSEYANRILVGMAVVLLVGVGVSWKDPNAFFAWLFWACELQFLFVTRPTNERPPPPEEPKPVPVTTLAKVPA